MASATRAKATRSKTAKRTTTSKSKTTARRLSNAKLLKLATKHRPPQRWYDEQVDPTQADRTARRER